MENNAVKYLREHIDSDPDTTIVISVKRGSVKVSSASTGMENLSFMKLYLDKYVSKLFDRDCPCVLAGMDKKEN